MLQVCSTASTMQESLRQLRAAKESRRKAATTKAVTFVTGVGLVAGGAGLTATGFGESISSKQMQPLAARTCLICLRVRHGISLTIEGRDLSLLGLTPRHMLEIYTWGTKLVLSLP